MNLNKVIVGAFTMMLLSGVLVACKKKDTPQSEYIQGLSDMAAQYNKTCPRDEGNGTKLESVRFEENTIIFRLSLSDKAIVSINLDNTRDSIINNMSDKLKKFLVKGNCNLEYKYVSPNDSSSITIVPNELGYNDIKEK